MIRIIIADDHAVVRAGLKQILSDTEEMKVVDEAASGHEMLEKIRSESYDLAILDITMPGMSGLDVVKEIKKINAKLPVLILSVHPEDQYAVRVLKSGADGYLTKDRAPEELKKAIRKLSKGGKYITDSLAEKLALDLSKGVEKPVHETLSDREYQVLLLIAAGKSVKEIAEELCLSVKTVSTYRSRILQKTGMKNNAEIIHYAVRENLA